MTSKEATHECPDCRQRYTATEKELELYEVYECPGCGTDVHFKYAKIGGGE